MTELIEHDAFVENVRADVMRDMLYLGKAEFGLQYGLPGSKSSMYEMVERAVSIELNNYFK